MDTSNPQLTPEQRAAIAAHPDQPLYIEDAETRETYLLLKAGKFPELEDEYVRARLEEGLAAIERGESRAMPHTPCPLVQPPPKAVP